MALNHGGQSTLGGLPCPVFDLDHYLALTGVARQTGTPVFLMNASKIEGLRYAGGMDGQRSNTTHPPNVLASA